MSPSAVAESAGRPKNILRRAAPTVAIAAACVAAYANGLGGPFVFDDVDSIAGNPTITDLRRIGDVLKGPHGGTTAGGRPILNLSLAICYAIGGLDVLPYHLMNVAIHAMAAVTLFGILRRTFELPSAINFFGGSAHMSAFFAALLWALHPLHTQAVTYVIQRAESLAGLFFLLAIYCLIRSGEKNIGTAAAAGGSLDASDPGGCERSDAGDKGPIEAPSPEGTAESNRNALRFAGAGSLAWQAAAVAACFAAVGTKEIAVAIPVFSLLYDRAFMTGSFGGSLRRRKYMYAGMAASWGLLAFLVVSASGRGGTIGASFPLVSPYEYALTQTDVIVHYLRLSFLPSPLTFDYGYPDAGVPIHRTIGTCWPYAAIVAALACATAAGIVKNEPAACIGAWFFSILAPTSSFVPIITEPVAEHRMYLPLAAVAVGFVIVLRRIEGALTVSLPADLSLRIGAVRIGIILICLTAAAILGTLTHLRNRDYSSELSLWEQTVRVRPENPRALASRAGALAKAWRTDEAEAAYRLAIASWPNYYLSHFGLGVLMRRQGRRDEAVSYLRVAAVLEPKSAKAWRELGDALADLGRMEEAARAYEEAAGLRSDAAEAAVERGLSAIRTGRIEDAERFFRQAVDSRPLSASARNNLANVLLRRGELAEAIEHYEEALRLAPDYADAMANLGLAFDKAGDPAKAAEYYDRALKLDPGMAEAHNNMANALVKLGRKEEAVIHYSRALELKPSLEEARRNLERLRKGMLRDRESSP